MLLKIRPISLSCLVECQRADGSYCYCPPRHRVPLRFICLAANAEKVFTFPVVTLFVSRKPPDLNSLKLNPLF